MCRVIRRFFQLLLCYLFIVSFLTGNARNLQAQSQEIAEFTVSAGEFDRLHTPVSASLEGIPLGLQTGLHLQLYEITDGEEKIATSQLDSDGYEKTLRWILTGKTPAGSKRSYILKRESDSNGSEKVEKTVHVEDDGKSLTLMVEDKNVLSYRYAPMLPPEGVSELYSRSGYIHPLWSPEGEVITRIQPPDHYHHYGIWNPWTRTEFEGREIDFWNLGDGQGTVRHKSLPVTIEGDVYGGFEALLDHVDLTAEASDGEKVALNEKWEVKVWNADPENDIWLIDFISTLNPASESPLTIKAYRYQGFSIRATEKWSDETATLLTSEGKDKSNGNATRARWTDINGVSHVGHSGILFMTHPGNHNFPEQLRIWPTGANGGEENVYFNFNPAQEQDWKLEPGNSYSLKYRMMVYDGKIKPATAESYWQDFGHPPEVEIIKSFK
jgi:hypothetical protein